MQILTTKSWQLILLVFISYFGSIELAEMDLEIVSIPLGIFSFFLIFFWYYSLGSFLYRKLERRDRNLYVLFSINCLYLLCFFGYSYLTRSNAEEKPIVEAPIYVYAIGIYYLIAYFQMIYYLTSNIQSYFSEKVVQKKFGGSIPLFFLLIFIPIGVLLIQPLLNEDFD